MQESEINRVINYQEVGSRIRELRKSHDLSQKEFAQALNISQGHLSRVEKGSPISTALCALIAEKFNTAMEFLLHGEEEKPLGTTTFVTTHTKSPELGSFGYSLEVADVITNSNKHIKQLLEACDYTYTFVVDEIRDIDSISDTNEQLYPTTSYTFDLSVTCLPFGYEWMAVERERSESNVDPLKDPVPEIELRKQMEAKGRKYIPKKTVKDSCQFEPYSFKMFSPFDLMDDEYRRFDDIGRYREAKEIALYNGTESPEDCFDPIVDELVPDVHVYLKDGMIDREAEFARFKNIIRSGVTGKTLIPNSFRALDAGFFVSGSGVVYKGRQYGLGTQGRIGISSSSHEFGGSELQFIVDDKRITAEQLIDMLSTYEGWELTFKITSR
jgi:transcriptional regulator with XRE-family HTH domain